MFVAKKKTFACGYMHDFDCKEGSLFGPDSWAMFLQKWTTCLVPYFCRCLISGLIIAAIFKRPVEVKNSCKKNKIPLVLGLYIACTI
jgi:preprotein translocase subunit SecG